MLDYSSIDYTIENFDNEQQPRIQLKKINNDNVLKIVINYIILILNNILIKLIPENEWNEQDNNLKTSYNEIVKELNENIENIDETNDNIKFNDTEKFLNNLDDILDDIDNKIIDKYDKDNISKTYRDNYNDKLQEIESYIKQQNPEKITDDSNVFKDVFNDINKLFDNYKTTIDKYTETGETKEFIYYNLLIYNYNKIVDKLKDEQDLTDDDIDEIKGDLINLKEDFNNLHKNISSYDQITYTTKEFNDTVDKLETNIESKIKNPVITISSEYFSEQLNDINLHLNNEFNTIKDKTVKIETEFNILMTTFKNIVETLNSNNIVTLLDYFKNSNDNDNDNSDFIKKFNNLKNKINKLNVLPKNTKDFIQEKRKEIEEIAYSNGLKEKKYNFSLIHLHRIYINVSTIEKLINIHKRNKIPTDFEYDSNIIIKKYNTILDELNIYYEFISNLSTTLSSSDKININDKLKILLNLFYTIDTTIPTPRLLTDDELNIVTQYIEKGIYKINCDLNDSDEIVGSAWFFYKLSEKGEKYSKWVKNNLQFSKYYKANYNEDEDNINYFNDFTKKNVKNNVNEDINEKWKSNPFTKYIFKTKVNIFVLIFLIITILFIIIKYKYGSSRYIRDILLFLSFIQTIRVIILYTGNGKLQDFINDDLDLIKDPIKNTLLKEFKDNFINKLDNVSNEEFTNNEASNVNSNKNAENNVNTTVDEKFSITQEEYDKFEKKLETFKNSFNRLYFYKHTTTFFDDEKAKNLYNNVNNKYKTRTGLYVLLCLGIVIILLFILNLKNKSFHYLFYIYLLTLFIMIILYLSISIKKTLPEALQEKNIDISPLKIQYCAE